MKGRNILIVVVVTLGILVVLDVVSRIVLSNIYNRKFDSSLIEPGKYGATDGLKANATGTVWGKPFHTDDMGGRKHTKTKTGKKKVLIIGDSVTEGVGIDDSSTIANLTNDSEEWADADVRNISMIGWSSHDYSNVIDHLFAADTAISEVYLFYCLNDIYGKSAVKDLPPIANKGVISEINGWLQDRYATYRLIKLMCYNHSDHYYQYDKALYEDPARVDATIADIVHVKQVCEAHKAHFMIMLVPYRSQLEHREDNLPQKILIGKFLKNDIQGMDLLRRWPQEDDYAALFLYGDEIHYSALGHSEMMRAIYGR